MFDCGARGTHLRREGCESSLKARKNKLNKKIKKSPKAPKRVGIGCCTFDACTVRWWGLIINYILGDRFFFWLAKVQNTYPIKDI